MDNPLKVIRQYKRRQGREVIVVKTDGQRIEGIMKTLGDTGITVEEEIKSKKKVIETTTHEIPFTDIKSNIYPFNNEINIVNDETNENESNAIG